MNKPARADDVLSQLRALSPDERAYVEAQLAKDAASAGRAEEPAFIAMIRDRAQYAVDHPEQNIAGDEFIAWLEKLRDGYRQK